MLCHANDNRYRYLGTPHYFFSLGSAKFSGFPRYKKAGTSRGSMIVMYTYESQERTLYLDLAIVAGVIQSPQNYA